MRKQWRKIETKMKTLIISLTPQGLSISADIKATGYKIKQVQKQMRKQWKKIKNEKENTLKK